MIRFSSVVLFLALANQSYGQIAIWNTSSLTGTTVTMNATTLNSNLTSPAILSRVGLTAESAANGFNSSNWSNAFDSSRYLTFTLTPNTDFQVNVTALSLRIDRSNATGSPTTLALRSSLDFTTNLATANISTAGTASQSVNFTGLNLTSTSGLAFRIYGFGGNNLGSTLRLENSGGFDAISVSGSVTAVPEPGSMILVGATGLVAMGWRRLRRSRSGGELTETTGSNS